MNPCQRFLLLLIVTALPGLAIAQGTVIVDQFYSPTLEQLQDMRVYLPEGYDPDAADPYPLVLYLHGANSSALDPVYDFLFPLLDELIGHQDPDVAIRPVVLVMPDGAATPYAGSMWADSDLYGDFATYVVDDVIDHVTTTYNVRTDRFGRAMCGYSMGGMGSMDIGLLHPELFCALGSVSGALDLSLMSVDFFPAVLAENQAQGDLAPYEYDPADGLYSYLAFTAAGGYSPNLANPPYMVDFPLDEDGNLREDVFARWLEHNSINHLADLTPGDLGLFLACGTSDELFFYPQNVNFSTTLTDLGHPHEFYVDGGGHFDMEYASHRIRAALQYIDEFFTDDVVAIAPGTDDGITPSGALTRLMSAAPNPFNPRTEIAFSLERAQFASLAIHDLAGRRVAVLTAEALPRGEHRAIWTGCDASGRAMPSGTYVARLVTEERVLTRKLQLVR